MNDFEEAVRELLSEAPKRPGVEDLETRARRRRMRFAMTAVVAAVAIAVATVNVAGALGHRSSGPHIAVSPTTSTTSTVPDALVQWCAESRFLDLQRAHLETLEQQLTNQLTEELATHSFNAGATDAAHQAVLREQSELEQRIVRLHDTRPSSAPCPPCASHDGALPQPSAAYNTEFQRLDVKRIQLQVVERTLNERLTRELAEHSPDAPATDAAHQSVLREQSDVQQQILHLEENRPISTACPAVEPGVSPADPSTP
jgi:hypothetical protein